MTDKNLFNNLCVVPNSGLMFIANEGKKIQTCYVPSLGPAPRWASFLHNLTEELQETITDVIYDDYKFVSESELQELGLEHSIGTNVIKSHLHGYVTFVDQTLYTFKCNEKINLYGLALIIIISNLLSQ